ncbi:DEAD/DEAH box helicase [Dactylosporangium sp. NPDC048998]|uniref:DEAD/DEAH box helicase n=1 Tax=Dactylosporangium sp. NPDC048998 TaxID=3363976 RepID=UPI00371FD2F9
MSTASGQGSVRADPWDDFLTRPADYFAMLSELGFLTEDENAVHGDLPEEIIEAVRNQALSGEHLTASLRGYQSFAARFALVQRKVIIGDEMGLGKTVEALAVLAHLRSRGETHFLVVCPAAVVTNWVREVTGKSKLRAHRVHGPERERAARTWVRDGGVAITTYETLAWWEPALKKVRDLACVVVDEAHYIKNPEAQRTIRTNNLITRADRAILLTGTPLENRVEEFRNLASYVRPDLTVDATDLSPRTFRRQIAPAYLRRNQEDVLTELPELVEVEEWLPMSAADVSRYRAAVELGNFMAMRQAAMLQGPKSTKVQRLIEIVREAEENERRVIVFSHLRQVLDLVARSLPGPVFGPLTGSVPASHRQQMVDEFSSAKHGAVLVAQIVAGGVGLNIQSASVVIICEPQLKATTEAQAIARAHRMGQVQSVQVHRLLSEDGVDQRIVELLAGKKRLFDDFARVSDTANSAPDAVDLSEAELAREVVAAERQRLFEGAPAET